MAKSGTVEVMQPDLYEHLAVQAWREVQSGPVEPERVELLKGKIPISGKKIKRFVCRLVGVGPAGSAVIGKRCRRANAMVENTIYEEILPYLPIASLKYYGMIEEANREFYWIFLEDAGDEVYSALDGGHRTLAVQWLGLMHRFAAHVADPDRLPDKGPNHYLKRLQSARDDILTILVNHTLQANDLALLETIVSQCNLLEANWDQVEKFYEGVPRTLVHNDFVAKNLRVRNSQTGMDLLAFDWGESGWGFPATDVMYVDATDYWLKIRGHWSWLNVNAIQRLAIVGKMYRSLDAMCWELHSFNFGRRLERTMNHLRIYASWLSVAIRAGRLLK